MPSLLLLPGLLPKRSVEYAFIAMIPRFTPQKECGVHLHCYYSKVYSPKGVWSMPSLLLLPGLLPKRSVEYAFISITPRFTPQKECGVRLHCYYLQVYSPKGVWSIPSLLLLPCLLYSTPELKYLLGSHLGVRRICLKIIHIWLDHVQKKFITSWHNIEASKFNPTLVYMPLKSIKKMTL